MSFVPWFLKHFSVWVFVGALCRPSPLFAQGDAYFVMVFGQQQGLRNPARHAHTFALFAHLTPENSLETFTISWLPKIGGVYPLRPFAQAGRNYDLPTTLAMTQQHQAVLSAWGPYQIDPHLWNRALFQKYRLENGLVRYKAYDFGAPTGRTSDCMHAVSYISRPPGKVFPYFLAPPTAWGEAGAYWTTLTLRPWIIEPCQTQDWLLSPLGVDGVPFKRHNLDVNPTPRLASRVWQGITHPLLLRHRTRCIQ